MPDSSVTLPHPQSEKSTNAPVQRDRTETSKANISALVLDGIEPIDKNSAQHRGDGDPVANEPRQVSEADNEGQKKLDDARDERLRRKVEQNALLQRKADEEYALQSARLKRGIDEMIASDNRKEGDDHVSENQAKDAAPLPIPANAPTTAVPAQYEHHPHAKELRGAFKPDRDPTEFDQRDLKLRQHRRQISSFLDDLAPSITDLKKDEAGVIWPYSRGRARHCHPGRNNNAEARPDSISHQRAKRIVRGMGNPFTAPYLAQMTCGAGQAWRERGEARASRTDQTPQQAKQQQCKEAIARPDVPPGPFFRNQCIGDDYRHDAPVGQLDDRIPPALWFRFLFCLMFGHRISPAVCGVHCIWRPWATISIARLLRQVRISRCL